MSGGNLQHHRDRFDLDPLSSPENFASGRILNVIHERGESIR